MMNQELLMSPNRLVTFLQKPAAEFTKADIINYIQQNEIRMVNFMYPAADGQAKNSEFCDKQCFLSGCHPDLW